MKQYQFEKQKFDKHPVKSQSQCEFIKLRFSEKATKLEKKIPHHFDSVA